MRDYGKTFIILKVSISLELLLTSKDFVKLKDPENSYLAKGIITSAK